MSVLIISANTFPLLTVKFDGSSFSGSLIFISQNMLLWIIYKIRHREFSFETNFCYVMHRKSYKKEGCQDM